MKEQKRLYHGTCRAFLAYALENKGKFGPENGEVSFSPNLGYSVNFAKQWKCSKNLEDYFGEIEDHLREPIILEINQEDLNLKYRNDCGNDEYFSNQSLDLSKVRRIYFKEGIEELLKGGKD
jgi:hypothetical protein